VSDNKRFLDLFRIKNIINALIGYIETKVELYKIQFKEEIAKALSILVLVIIFSMIGLLFVFFLSHFIAQIINNYTESYYTGYLVVTFLYLLIGIIIYFTRNKIKDSIIDMMFPEEVSENNDSHEQ
jgi:uncharacterized membrane protein YqjE